ncbi:hypothetical protein MGU_01799 [Metarhizium guizhouense ARSEF 977]|uniref:Mid2-like cell wall stress sensor n=1 Tax=Metarhizium guizhouense (strain ARSEF 977) TaxID=1276136 RepID=A0A0B4IBU1_METGA|nr:hypothetical protein MGU_01799 [Metarhizium guizhouense ARSEF 977]
MAPYGRLLLSVSLAFLQFNVGDAWNRHFSLPRPTATLSHRAASALGKRLVHQTEMSTCGYQDGDPKKFRTAESGFNCRVDTVNGLWGFCPTTVIAATDCGLQGFCVDSHSCSGGCGNGDNSKLTTFTCASLSETEKFCSFAALTFGVDQTYTYYACGGTPTTIHYLASPTAQATPTNTNNVSKTSDASSKPTSVNTSMAGSAQPSSWTIASRTTAQSSQANAKTDSAAATSKSGSSRGGDSDGVKADSSPNTIGTIIGGVIGGIAVLCIFGLAAIYLLRRSRSNRCNRSPSPNLPAPLESAETPGVNGYKYSNRRTGGWGPSELPASEYGRPSLHPVELPT